jgi:ABC-type sugar transport system ATPase subunit
MGSLLPDCACSMRAIQTVKARSQNARIVIMDEPASSITDCEVEILFSLIADFKSKGTAIVYISHKIDEILQISDEISILRDGENVGTRQSDIIF